MIVIDAKNLILGRLSAYAAKQALQGETVHIINADKAVITGDKKRILESYRRKRELGGPLIGPFHLRMPDRLVKRCIRGMLSYKAPRGKEAFARIKCHIGVPSSLSNVESVSLPKMSVDKTHAKYVFVETISKELGAKL
jgi:large subunit ribosomal protein L13